MDATTIGAITTTLSTIIVALFGFLATRDKRTRELAEKQEKTLDELRDDLEEQRHRLDVAMIHIYDLRRHMAEHGVPLPPLPVELNPTEKKQHHHRPEAV